MISAVERDPQIRLPLEKRWADGGEHSQIALLGWLSGAMAATRDDELFAELCLLFGIALARRFETLRLPSQVAA